MGEPERWQQCEDMNHVGPTKDATVHWRELGLMCDTCFAAFGDTRPLLDRLQGVIEERNDVRKQLAAREGELRQRRADIDGYVERALQAQEEIERGRKIAAEDNLRGAVSLSDAEWERVLWWLHKPLPPGPAKALDEAIIRKITTQRGQ